MEPVRSAANKVWRYCSLILVLELLLMSRVSCRPSYRAEFPSDNINYCRMNDDINALCQRCAKSTQSNVVFPMCCRNTEDVLDWCDQYVNNFGIRGS